MSATTTHTIHLTATKPSQRPAASSDSEFKQNVDDLVKNPLERTWRSNKEGTVRLQSVPDFKGDKYAEREWVKVSCYPVSVSSIHGREELRLS